MSKEEIKERIFIWADAVRVGITAAESKAITRASSTLHIRHGVPLGTAILGRHGRLSGTILAMLLWYCEQRGYDPELSIDDDVYFYAKRGRIFNGNYEQLHADNDEPGGVVTLTEIDDWVAEFNIGSLFIEKAAETAESGEGEGTGDDNPATGDDPAPADPTPAS